MDKSTGFKRTQKGILREKVCRKERFYEVAPVSRAAWRFI